MCEALGGPVQRDPAEEEDREHEVREEGCEVNHLVVKSLVLCLRIEPCVRFLFGNFLVNCPTLGDHAILLWLFVLIIIISTERRVQQRTSNVWTFTLPEEAMPLQRIA